MQAAIRPYGAVLAPVIARVGQRFGEVLLGQRTVFGDGSLEEQRKTRLRGGRQAEQLLAAFVGREHPAHQIQQPPTGA